MDEYLSLGHKQLVPGEDDSSYDNKVPGSIPGATRFSE